MISSLLSFVNASLGAISSLPLGAHAIPVALLVCGCIFWLAGARFLKQVFGLIGIASGAGLAAVFASDLLPSVGPVPGPYVAMAIGGVVGLIASILAFRFSMALCGAVVLAAAGALGTGVYLSHKPDALPLGPAVEARDRLSPSAEELGGKLREAAEEYQKAHDPGAAAPPATPPAHPGTAEAVEATRQFAGEVESEARELWSTTPERSRLLLLAGALCGAVIGAAAGMATPKRAAAVVTAVLGAGLTLVAAGWLSRAFNFPGAHLITDRSPAGILGVWAGLAAFGVLVQLRSGSKKASRPAAPPAPQPAPPGPQQPAAKA